MKNINSENPAEHWNGLNVKDRCVLDLGCGLFGQPIEWNTPTYFLDNGATHVFGVDSDGSSFDRIHWYSHSRGVWKDQLIFDYNTISSSEDLERAIWSVKPDVIKCDIEGAERYFMDVDANTMVNVLEVAVEYHDPITKAICETKFKQWGYSLEYNTLLGHSIDRIGVIYAKRSPASAM